ncbi:elongation factor P--(R)-beta-lysine ligase, partial [Leptospira sp. 96542]|nr:elongation factor P--(R)-beta-lysine ligase [Leptospira sp. 96542]
KLLWEKDFIEVDSPCLKPVVGMEPYLDPFLVTSPDGKEKGYLITSPEYSLKQMMATGLEKIFEITHTFRSGESGSSIHTKEFLMLELYVKGFDDTALRKFIVWLLEELLENYFDSQKPESTNPKVKIQEKTVESVFIEHTGSGFQKTELIQNILHHHLSSSSKEELGTWQYEDLFFLVFLNLVEPKLGDGILFLYDYPAECAALAKIEGGVAKRFEIYWDGIELANAFYELTDADEQKERFTKEQILRKKLGKEIFPMDLDFLHALANGFPECSGISIGLDRLILKLANKSDLAEVSPYWKETMV